MVMRATGSFHYPETRFISRGTAWAKGNGYCLYPEKPHFNCFIVPIQYSFVRSFTLDEFYYDYVKSLM